METTYYTLTAREIIVSGDGISAAVGAPACQLVCVRRPASQEEQAQDNVIDLAAWKAAREEETRLEEEWYAGVDEALAEPAPIPPRPRRNHQETGPVGRGTAGHLVRHRDHGSVGGAYSGVRASDL